MTQPARYRYLDPSAQGRLRNLNLIARSVVEGFIAGLHRSPYRGFSAEFVDHREYTPGDDTRDIDWQAYGRSDRYYIKQYQEETNLKAHLLLDVSASMGYRSDRSALSKLDYACYLAACLAYLMIRQRDSVGLVCFDRKIRFHMPPGGTPLHLNTLLRQLEETRARRTTRVSRAFHDLAEHIHRRGLIIVLSDLYDEPREVIRGLCHFRYKHHEVIVFHILDQAEMDFPFRRLSDFVDLETKERLQVDPRYVREEYRRLLDEFLRQYQRDCAAANIEYLLADTATPYDRALVSFLSARKKYA